MQALQDLIREYNVPGPRYTSYPTALNLSPITDVSPWMDNIRMVNQVPGEISLYVHIPFCRSLCWYCGCHKEISKKKSDGDRYVEYLVREMDLMLPSLSPQNTVVQLHLGGGTPTFLSNSALTRLMDAIYDRFTFSETAELGIEIDPRYLDEEMVQTLHRCGFNRASLGVQDVNEEVQRAIHRHQPFQMTRDAMRWLRKAGFKSVNIDLIYGLPAQNPERFEHTIREVLTVTPDRLAIYNYAHLPSRFPAQRLIPIDDMPHPDDKIRMLQIAIETLTDAGYEYIGMDHFALPTDELSAALHNGTIRRNFQGYSTKAGTDTYAFGVSSISSIGTLMLQNEKNLDVYYSELDQGRHPLSKGYSLTHNDQIRKEIIMNLLCVSRVNWIEIADRWGLNKDICFIKERLSLIPLIADGMVEVGLDEFRVTPLGRLFVRNIAMIFDEYLALPTLKPAFSRTV